MPDPAAFASTESVKDEPALIRWVVVIGSIGFRFRVRCQLESKFLKGGYIGDIWDH